jgi:hypothetical protein
MTRRRLCGACETELVGRQERWCSHACAVWVSSAGGREAAAEIFESWASGWDGAYSSGDRKEYLRTAAVLRARRLRFPIRGPARAGRFG